MSCPWARIQQPEHLLNLKDIMSEEVARHLEEKKKRKVLAEQGIKEDVGGIGSEHFLPQEDNKKLDNLADDIPQDVLNPFSDSPSDSEEDDLEDLLDEKYRNRFGNKVKRDMITKPDLAKNACELLSFLREFKNNDGVKFDLASKISRSLRYIPQQDMTQHCMPAKKDTEYSIDQFSRLVILRMVHNGLLETVDGVINIGKEGVVLHAKINPSFQLAKASLPKEVAIKVFKTTDSEFKQRDNYVEADHRFKSKKGTRKTVIVWAEKEMEHLLRLKRAGLNCPDIVTLKQHILVMSFIGENNRPAPKLRDANFEDEDYPIAYEGIVEGMKILYSKANLIHGDLTDYNILWHQKKCYFIDVNQAVDPSHEAAFHLLYRDCCNIITFFEKKEYLDIATPDGLFEQIVGCSFGNRIALASIRESFKMKPRPLNESRSEMLYDFDIDWEIVQAEEIP